MAKGVHGLGCLNCGYSLRGLSGDPIRCPECGEANALSDLRMRRRVYGGELLRLETMCTVSAAGVLVFFIMLPIGWVAFRSPYFWGFVGLAWFGVLYGAIRFGARCCWRAGWLKVLASYQLPLLWFPAGMGVFAAVERILTASGFGSGRRWLLPLVSMGLLAVPGVFFSPMRLYDRGKRQLHDFCRGVAIARAKAGMSRPGSGANCATDADASSQSRDRPARLDEPGSQGSVSETYDSADQ